MNRDFSQHDETDKNPVWNRLIAVILEQLDIDNENISPGYNLLEKNQKVNCYSNDIFSKWTELGNSSSSYNLFGNSRYGDYGINELDRIELIMAIEEEFDIEISDEQAEKLTTVQSLFDLIISKT